MRSGNLSRDFRKMRPMSLKRAFKHRIASYQTTFISLIHRHTTFGLHVCIPVYIKSICTDFLTSSGPANSIFRAKE